jgi:hypothetical protein
MVCASGYQDPANLTRDVGGTASTSKFVSAVVSRL